MGLYILKLGLLAILLSEVRSIAPAGGAAPAPAAAPAAAGAAGAAGAAATGARAAHAMPPAPSMPAEHVFCNYPPYPQPPKMPIFNMTVTTGFRDGFRSNQSVIVEITARYPKIWRINQLFIHVPETNPSLQQPIMYGHRHMPMPNAKHVGKWLDVIDTTPSNAPIPTAGNERGHVRPVNCGGDYQFGMIGSHAATLTPVVEPHKGFTRVLAKWIPPINSREVAYRQLITIVAYVTFEKTPPRSHHQNSYYRQKSARFVKKQISLYNLDYMDIHRYMQSMRPYFTAMQRLMRAIKK
nr:hypothetical protein [Crepidula fornicata]